jgi:hypothetical protein
MLYLGVDLHKRNCWVTVLDQDGHEREQRKLSTERVTLLEYFGKLPKPANAGAPDAFVSKISSPFSVSLSPAGLKFGSQVLNTTSASQAITLLNTGVMPQFWSPVGPPLVGALERAGTRPAPTGRPKLRHYARPRQSP